ncbi:MAG: sugar ABC transporter permease [Clostridia bacterium]
MRKRTLRLRERDCITAYALFIPTFCLLCLFLVWPTLNVLLISLTKSNLLRPEKGSVFNWGRNFVALFSDREFCFTVLRSLFYTFSATAVSLLLSYFTAVLVHREFRGKGLAIALLFLPWVVSDVVTSFVFKWSYDTMYGIFNYLLCDVLHVLKEPIAWLGNQHTAFPAVIVANIWKLLPFSTLSIIAALKQVPLEITESARVDGASAVRTHVSIIIPYLKAPLAILLTLRIGALFRSFDITWLLTKGGPGYATTTLPIQYYKTAFEAMDVGKGSAVAVVILLFVFLVYFGIYKSFGKDAFS